MLDCNGNEIKLYSNVVWAQRLSNGPSLNKGKVITLSSNSHELVCRTAKGRKVVKRSDQVCVYRMP